jgi:nucleoside-diphosphate-sugar epimerase
MRDLVVTGASGFLGASLIEAARSLYPDVRVHAIESPRCGGIDLARPDAFERLGSEIRIAHPEEAALIHAAAIVDWDESERALTSNPAMALNVARWSRDVRLGFSVLVSTVNVYPSASKIEAVDTSVEPPTLYGVGKLAAEHVWRILLPEDQRATVRLAGIWGWQSRPTMFWNRLLQAASNGSQAALVVRRGASFRNYISASEAGECLLRVAANKVHGLFLGAGRDTVDTRTFVSAVQELPLSRLEVEWQDDGGRDQTIFTPSPELLPYLKPFPSVLANLWRNRPKREAD